MIPVVEYPQWYLDELQKEIDEIKVKLAAGEWPVFDSVDALFEWLEKD